LVVIKRLFAWDAAPLDPFADGLLVPVRRGRVDQAVADLDRVLNASCALLQVGHLEDAEAQHRHLHAVVQLDGGDG